jgi:Ca2+-binding RTX toxin-like protein
MSWGNRIALLVAVVGALLVSPATASAAEVARLLGSSLVGLNASGGELNQVVIAHGMAGHLFTDESGVTAGAGCLQVSPTQARCPSSPDDQLFAFLSDGDDDLSTSADFPILVCGGFGHDVIQTGPQLDGIWGEEGADVMRGGGGTDVIFAETHCAGTSTSLVAGGDTLDGEDGNDILQGGEGDDSLAGGAGNDTLFALEGNDSLDGGTHDDDLRGFEGNDELAGGDGDDRLGGGEGNDSEAGGDGVDLLGLTHVHNGAVHLNDGDDLLDGGPGDDRLNAGPGATFLNFGEPSVPPFESDATNGADDFRGGDGRDFVSYANRSAAVAVSMEGTADDGSTDEHDNVRPDIESVEGGSGDDVLRGGPGPNEFNGGRGSDEVDGADGDDVLAGGLGDGGADRLRGGGGADSLQGQTGPDSLIGGSGEDTLAGGSGRDTIAGEEGEDAATGGTGLDSISGGPGDDNLDGGQPVLVGADGADRVAGNAGNDSVAGGPGDDTLAGGPGHDGISGGAGLDSVDYRGARRAVTVTFDGLANDGEPRERDDVQADVEGIIGGEEEDTMKGDGGANSLTGGPGEDFLDGAAGSDFLRGGGGADTLSGRDGDRDLVQCGAGRDFAIVDGTDAVGSDCEVIDETRRSSIVFGRALLRPLRGPLRLRLSRRQRSVPLEYTAQVPLPAAIDTRKGAVYVIVASGGRRSRSARLSGGRLLIRQRNPRRPVAGVRVLGRERASCRRSASRGVLGRVIVSSRGGFRTRGRAAFAVGRNATWLTEERCTGTLVRARRGRVMVIDLGARRRVAVRAGRSYLARAR